MVLTIAEGIVIGALFLVALYWALVGALALTCKIRESEFWFRYGGGCAGLAIIIIISGGIYTFVVYGRFPGW